MKSAGGKRGSRQPTTNIQFNGKNEIGLAAGIRKSWNSEIIEKEEE